MKTEMKVAKRLDYKQLGIKEQEFWALLHVRDELERGDIVHFDCGAAVDAVVTGVKKRWFDMGVGGDRHGCGTLGCIGGWMYAAMHPKARVGRMQDYVDRHQGVSSPFHELFFGRTWSSITPAQGVKAIDNFLEFGKPDWEEVLGR